MWYPGGFLKTNLYFFGFFLLYIMKVCLLFHFFTGSETQDNKNQKRDTYSFLNKLFYGKGEVTAYEPEGPSGRRLSPVSVALSD